MHMSLEMEVMKAEYFTIDVQVFSLMTQHNPLSRA
jgi:hypothetical protein